MTVPWWKIHRKPFKKKSKQNLHLKTGSELVENEREYSHIFRAINHRQ
jgi:hypothetical protein